MDSNTPDISVKENGRDRVRFTDLLPGIIKNGRRLPAIAASGISIALLFDDLPLSLGSILEKNARRYSNQIALIYEDRSFTYHELNSVVNKYANYFKEQGIGHGDVVILLLENRPEALIITSALAKLGAIASLINPQQRGEVLLHSIRLKYGRHFVIGEEMLDVFEEIRDSLEPDNIALMGLADRGDRKFPKGYTSLQHVIQHSSTENPPETKQVRTKDHLAYIFTSGTTGMPKASIQTHKKWLRCMHWFGKINLSLNSEDVLYAPLPFFHANVFLIAWPTVFTHGATLVMRRKFSVKDFWKDIDKYNATSFIYIGEICRYLLNAPVTDKDKSHSVVKIIGNGLRPDIWHSFKERFGIKSIFEFYGASDSNIIFTNTLNIDYSVGWSPVEFAIVDYDVDKDEPVRNKKGRCERVGTGQVGLMLSRITSRFPFDGYVNSAGNDGKVFRDVFKKGDEWFNTGDLMRNMGYKHTQFVDRIGDTFRWKGENVATAEVEQIINSLSFVDSSAVYGVQIPHCDGRAGMAAMVSKVDPENVDMKMTARILKDKLPAYAVPCFIRFTERLETTRTQKIVKNGLKKQGFDPEVIEDQIFYLMPGSESYQRLTQDDFKMISEGRSGF